MPQLVSTTFTKSITLRELHAWLGLKPEHKITRVVYDLMFKGLIVDYILVEQHPR